MLTIFTLRDVRPGEELCFSYAGGQEDETGDNKEEEVDDHGQEKKKAVRVLFSSICRLHTETGGGGVDA